MAPSAAVKGKAIALPAHLEPGAGNPVPTQRLAHSQLEILGGNLGWSSRNVTARPEIASPHDGEALPAGLRAMCERSAAVSSARVNSEAHSRRRPPCSSGPAAKAGKEPAAPSAKSQSGRGRSAAAVFPEVRQRALAVKPQRLSGGGQCGCVRGGLRSRLPCSSAEAGSGSSRRDRSPRARVPRATRSCARRWPGLSATPRCRRAAFTRYHALHIVLDGQRDHDAEHARRAP
jgi:hypothetical protein